MEALKMKINYSEVNSEYREKFNKFFGVKDGMIEVNPGKFIIPRRFKELGERILGLEVRLDDVWLISYPRTGSNWTQEIIWCLINNLDYEGSKLLSQVRIPVLELTAIFGNDHREWTHKYIPSNSVDQTETMPSPRCVKTHLPWDLLPTKINYIKPKIIYIARNPKDCCVSYYHNYKLIHEFHGSLNDFCELFLLGKSPMGNMWEHVREFWNRRNEQNILFLKYEDMKRNHFNCIKMISKFLGKDYSDEELQGLVDHTSFSKMRENPAINLERIVDKMHSSSEQKPNVKFLRKGQVGDWKNYMTNDMARKFDEQSRKWWSNIGLTFDDEL